MTQLRFMMETTSSGDVPFVTKSVPCHVRGARSGVRMGQDNIKVIQRRVPFHVTALFFSCMDNGEISACMSCKDLTYIFR